jgi:hypothetical protein
MSKHPGDKAYQAFCILKFAFVVAPILAGLDKFFYLLADWSQYVAPVALHYVQDYLRTFFLVIGVIEIIAGIGVFLKPSIFAYVVAVWLLVIIVNLVMVGHYFDVALRDLGLLLGALALAKLSEKYAPFSSASQSNS